MKVLQTDGMIDIQSYGRVDPNQYPLLSVKAGGNIYFLIVIVSLMVA